MSLVKEFNCSPSTSRKAWQKLLSTYRSVASSKVLGGKVEAYVEKMGKAIGLSDLNDVKTILASVADNAALFDELNKLPGEMGKDYLEKLQSAVDAVHGWVTASCLADDDFVKALNEIAGMASSMLEISDDAGHSKLAVLIDDPSVHPSIPEIVGQKFLLRCCLAPGKKNIGMVWYVTTHFIVCIDCHCN